MSNRLLLLQPDVLSQFPVFKKCKRAQANLDVSLTYVASAKNLEKDVLDWMFNLTQKNMKEIYNKTDGWSWKPKVSSVA